MSTEKTTIILEITNREAEAVRRASFYSQPRMHLLNVIRAAGHHYHFELGYDKTAKWELELTDAEAQFLVDNCASRSVVRALKKVL